MKFKISRLFLLLVPVSLVLILSACNTMEGMGEDMSAAGKAVTGEAEEKKDY